MLTWCGGMSRLPGLCQKHVWGLSECSCSGPQGAGQETGGGAQGRGGAAWELLSLDTITMASLRREPASSSQLYPKPPISEEFLEPALGGETVCVRPSGMAEGGEAWRQVGSVLGQEGWLSSGQLRAWEGHPRTRKVPGLGVTGSPQGSTLWERGGVSRTVVRRCGRGSSRRLDSQAEYSEGGISGFWRWLCTRLPQTVWLGHQKCVPSQSWRPDVQDQAVSRAELPPCLSRRWWCWLPLVLLGLGHLTLSASIATRPSPCGSVSGPCEVPSRMGPGSTLLQCDLVSAHYICRPFISTEGGVPRFWEEHTF